MLLFITLFLSSHAFAFDNLNQGWQNPQTQFVQPMPIPTPVPIIQMQPMQRRPNNLERFQEQMNQIEEKSERFKNSTLLLIK